MARIFGLVFYWSLSWALVSIGWATAQGQVIDLVLEQLPRDYDENQLAADLK